MPQLSQSEKADRYDKSVMRRKADKVIAHVTMLRLTETVVNGVVSVGLGALKEAKPEWEQAAYGLPIDITTGGLGFAAFVMAGDGRDGDYIRETGGGMMQAAIGSLGQKGGRALYRYIQS